jgi:hypothetical protein
MNKNKLTQKQKQRAYYERRHLDWKEKRRDRLLRWKDFKGKIKEEEYLEWEDLKFVEVMAKGQTIPQVRKLEDLTWIEVQDGTKFEVHNSKLIENKTSKKRKLVTEQEYKMLPRKKGKLENGNEYSLKEIQIIATT